MKVIVKTQLTSEVALGIGVSTSLKDYIVGFDIIRLLADAKYCFSLQSLINTVYNPITIATQIATLANKTPPIATTNKIEVTI